MVITDFDELYGLEIPDGWTVEKLEPKVGNVKSGKRLPKGYYVVDTHTNHPYIRVIDMRQGYVDTSDLRYVPEEAFSAIQNYRIYKDDIYISVAGTLGIVGQIPEHLDGANLTENANRVTNIKCNIKYLMYWLMGSIIQNTISQTQTLGAQPKLALKRIRNFPVILPPEKEQEKIAGALSDVDTLITDLQKLIRKKKDIRQGTLQKIMTGKNRLQGFNKQWKDTTLGKICDIKDGTHQTPHYVESGIPFYSVETVTNDDFTHVKYISLEEHERLTSSYKIENGDVLMTRIGSIGKGKFVDWNPNASFYVSLALLKFRGNKLLANFIALLAETEAFRKEAELHSLQFAIPMKINLGQISDIRVKIPTDENETKVIVNILNDMNCEIKELEQKLEKYQMIKQGMMEELLTGKVRLS